MAMFFFKGYLQKILCLYTRVAFILTVFLLCFSISKALDCEMANGTETITVDQSGKGKFKTVQSAIDSVPSKNNKWMKILISAGDYREKVTIPHNKPCIFLEGAGIQLTSIEWGDHNDTASSATFTSSPDNIVARGITFKNNYNISLEPYTNNKVIQQAVTARIYGDKSVFYECGFMGLQDTLWDVQGRHYFKNCYIEGAIDFIFGRGQSIYEACHININIGNYAPEHHIGEITAQARNSSDDPSAFVFKYCVFAGTGKANLGRAYGAYSRVIIYNSNMTDAVNASGWDAWSHGNHVENLVYVEVKCTGPGANTTNRVTWMKKLDAVQLFQFLDISYIDKEGWIAKQPRPKVF